MRRRYLRFKIANVFGGSHNAVIHLEMNHFVFVVHLVLNDDIAEFIRGGVVTDALCREVRIQAGDKYG